MFSAGFQSDLRSTCAKNKIETLKVADLQNPALNIPAVVKRSLFRSFFEINLYYFKYY